MIDVNVNLSRWPGRRLPLDETPILLAKLRKAEVQQAWVGSFDGLLLLRPGDLQVVGRTRPLTLALMRAAIGLAALLLLLCCVVSVAGLLLSDVVALAVGAFIGGLALSASPYAHQLFAEVLPLRGVLLGLFFTAVRLAIRQLSWDDSNSSCSSSLGLRKYFSLSFTCIVLANSKIASGESSAGTGLSCRM